jgi:uncharacterized membrane protein
VLELHRPQISIYDAAHLTAALSSEWTAYVAYVLSFAVIGIMWINHHALFRTVVHIDRATLLMNLLLLGVTASIPFATNVLGTYPTLAPAAELYGATLTSSAIAFNLLFAHLRRSNAFSSEVPEAAIARNGARYRIGVGVYACATLVAFWFPLVALGAYCAITIYFLLPGGVDTDFR